MRQPDPNMHFQISMYKSTLRIVAGAGLIMGMPVFCGIFIILAELLGVWEELV